jgi:hypothetical protein
VKIASVFAETKKERKIWYSRVKPDWRQGSNDLGSLTLDLGLEVFKGLFNASLGIIDLRINGSGDVCADTPQFL